MIFGEPDSSAQNAQPQRVRFDISQMHTFYANFFALAGSAEEIAVYLGTNTPIPGAKEPVVRVEERMVLSPSNAKRLMVALQQTIKAHEDRFGPIEITPPRPPGQQT